MASSSRTSLFKRIQKILKGHYPAVAPAAERSVFEHTMFACCLENAHYDQAELALAALADTDPDTRQFFDWNEIRVSTVRELSEAMGDLPNAPAAANRVKRVLQSIFESTFGEANYGFDLEDLRKQNLGPAVEQLRKIDGATNFVVSYVIQAALSGHAIPVDAGTVGALHVVGLVSEKDVKARVVPGLERAIPKSKGVEFASQLHQLAADFVANPYSSKLRGILLEIAPDAKDRLPKRGSRKRAQSGDSTPEGGLPAGTKKAPDKQDAGSSKGASDVQGAGDAKKAGGAKKQADKKKAEKKQAARAASGKAAEPKRRRAAPKKTSSSRKKAVKADSSANPEEQVPDERSASPPAKKAAPKGKASAKRKSEADQRKSAAEGTKPSSTGLSKRKPR